MPLSMAIPCPLVLLVRLFIYQQYVGSYDFRPPNTSFKETYSLDTCPPLATQLQVFEKCIVLQQLSTKPQTFQINRIFLGLLKRRTPKGFRKVPDLAVLRQCGPLTHVRKLSVSCFQVSYREYS